MTLPIQTRSLVAASLAAAVLLPAGLRAQEEKPAKPLQERKETTEVEVQLEEALREKIGSAELRKTIQEAVKKALGQARAATGEVEEVVRESRSSSDGTRTIRLERTVEDGEGDVRIFVNGEEVDPESGEFEIEGLPEGALRVIRGIRGGGDSEAIRILRDHDGEDEAESDYEVRVITELEGLEGLKGLKGLDVLKGLGEWKTMKGTEGVRIIKGLEGLEALEGLELDGLEALKSLKGLEVLNGGDHDGVLHWVHGGEDEDHDGVKVMLRGLEGLPKGLQMLKGLNLGDMDLGDMELDFDVEELELPEGMHGAVKVLRLGDGNGVFQLGDGNGVFRLGDGKHGFSFNVEVDSDDECCDDEECCEEEECCDDDDDDDEREVRAFAIRLGDGSPVQFVSPGQVIVRGSKGSPHGHAEVRVHRVSGHGHDHDDDHDHGHEHDDDDDDDSPRARIQELKEEIKELRKELRELRKEMRGRGSN